MLGLLMLQKLSLYDLKKAFNRTLSLFYSDSLGSLQVAVRKLEEKGFVEKHTEFVGRRARHLLSITPTGYAAFHQEMQAPLPNQRQETALLTRLFFMGLVPATDRQRLATQLEAAIVASLVQLEEQERQLAELKLPADYLVVFEYQKATLDYALMSHRATLQWWRNRFPAPVEQE